jgi:hypothetical protein
MENSYFTLARRYRASSIFDERVRILAAMSGLAKRGSIAQQHAARRFLEKHLEVTVGDNSGHLVLTRVAGLRHRVR